MTLQTYVITYLQKQRKTIQAANIEDASKQAHALADLSNNQMILLELEATPFRTFQPASPPTMQ